MQFSEALALVRANSQRTDCAPLRLHLAAGFTANHLAMFMTAHAAATRQDRRVSCSTGRYGDVVMALDDPQSREAHVAMVALEWADLDPRLGLRRYVLAVADCADDILRTVHARLDMLAEAIIRQADCTPVILSLPTLPFPPVFTLPGRQSGLPEIILRRQLLTFAERCLGARGVIVISSDRLSRHSALIERRSATGEVGADMPYRQRHLAMFEQIRDLYGRERVSDDDRLRAASIRRNAEVMNEAAARTGSAAETFLKELQARLVFNFSINPEDDRPFDLVNKTNQFNLNGRRIDAAEWKRHVRAGDRFALAISYADKFGPLGTISIAAGHIEGSQIVLTVWVLSCRAFARRIEHATLAVLCERLKLHDVRLDFRVTDKNAPFQDFLASLEALHESDHALLINPTSSLPPLYHEREIHEP